MEEITLNVFEMLSSYGALGAVAIYFMWKDSTVNKALTQTLNDLTVAIETLIKQQGVSHE